MNIISNAIFHEASPIFDETDYGGEVLLNPNFNKVKESFTALTLDPVSGNAKQLTIPDNIIVRHELIHVYHSFHGTYKYLNGNGYYLRGAKNSKYVYDLTYPEELDTVGIDYYTPIYNERGILVGIQRIQVSNYELTENALRKEQMKKIGIRIQY